MKNHMRRAAEKFDLFSIPSLIKCGFKYFFKRLFFSNCNFSSCVVFWETQQKPKVILPTHFCLQNFFYVSTYIIPTKCFLFVLINLVLDKQPLVTNFEKQITCIFIFDTHLFKVVCFC